MPDLKGTKTHQNLKDAFAGESQANRRYLYFAKQADIEGGERVEIGNSRGEVVLHAKLFDGVRRGVVIAEGIWPNDAHERGEGITVLTGADAPAPYGGAAFHDNKVWLRAAA
jgi:anaerobic selenocysteine-containing dehydrogenase